MDTRGRCGTSSLPEGSCRGRFWPQSSPVLSAWEQTRGCKRPRTWGPHVLAHSELPLRGQQLFRRKGNKTTDFSTKFTHKTCADFGQAQTIEKKKKNTPRKQGNEVVHAGKTRRGPCRGPCAGGTPAGTRGPIRKGPSAQEMATDRTRLEVRLGINKAAGPPSGEEAR